MSAAAKALACALLALAMVAGCGRAPAPTRPAGPPAALVTTALATAGTLEVTERTLGSLEALMDPKVGAEVAGRVLRVHARTGAAVRRGDLLAEIDATDAAIQSRADEADAKRIEALLVQAERLVTRQEELLGRGFISRNALDDVTAQRNALREQLAVARARAEAGRRGVAKTRVTSPIDARVEVQIVSPGDYVKVGDPLFQLISSRRLRAHLPFPESAAGRMRPGLAVRITSPQTGSRVFEGVIGELRPNLADGSRAVDVLVDIDNDGSLRGGGSVDAEVVLDRRNEAVQVPEQSIVLRPAGTVVYVVVEGKARQRAVRTGTRRQGMVEIVDGLAAGETVAVDGAGFLADGTAVNVKPPAAVKAGKPDKA